MLWIKAVCLLEKAGNPADELAQHNFSLSLTAGNGLARREGVFITAALGVRHTHTTHMTIITSAHKRRFASKALLASTVSLMAQAQVFTEIDNASPMIARNH